MVFSFFFPHSNPRVSIKRRPPPCAPPHRGSGEILLPTVFGNLSPQTFLRRAHSFPPPSAHYANRLPNIFNTLTASSARIRFFFAFRFPPSLVLRALRMLDRRPILSFSVLSAPFYYIFFCAARTLRACASLGLRIEPRPVFFSPVVASGASTRRRDEPTLRPDSRYNPGSALNGGVFFAPAPLLNERFFQLVRALRRFLSALSTPRSLCSLLESVFPASSAPVAIFLGVDFFSTTSSALSRLPYVRFRDLSPFFSRRALEFGRLASCPASLKIAFSPRNSPPPPLLFFRR